MFWILNKKGPESTITRAALMEKKEFCGVVGVYSKKQESVAPILYRAMLALQHRGQDAAGFTIWNKGFVEKKGTGLVENVFNKKDLETKGNAGIGHTRYPTVGTVLLSDIQPFRNTGKPNIALAHNGQISNYRLLKQELEKKGFEFSSSVDSEIIVYMILEKLKQGKTIEQGIKEIMKKLDGAYSICSLIENALVVFRDPAELKPLVWGENKSFIVFASESAALDINGIQYKGDVKGGEIAIVRNGKMKIKKLVNRSQNVCMFEYVYFSRPDSIINEKNVMEIRKNLGKELANEHPIQGDVVIEVPDSARTAAKEYARSLNIEYEEGLIKNRYIGRTFIMPSQKKRIHAVRMKLNPVKSILNKKRVILIDDSLVRGTTLKEIISSIRKAGAKEVHARITCPPIKAPCFYGIDMSSYKELAAYKKSIKDIEKMIGADSLKYLSIQGLKRAIGLSICTGCLDENYPTAYAKKLGEIEKKRSVSK